MFLGFYTANITQKNQLTFPGKFKEEVGKKLFIAPWFEKSLIVLPFEKAQEALDRILQGSISLLPEVRDLETILYAEAQEAHLDKRNRFVIEKRLCEYANIHKKVVFLGIKDRIEIWDEEIYTNYGQIRKMQIRQTAINLYNQITSTTKS